MSGRFPSARKFSRPKGIAAVFDESPDEIERRLGAGGPSWDRCVADVSNGATTAQALDDAGVPRLRYKAFLKRFAARARDMREAEVVRDEKRKELVNGEMMRIALDPDTQVKDKIRAFELLGRDVSLFKDAGIERAADTLEALLLRSFAKPEPLEVEAEEVVKPVLRLGT